jgi:hypothetical protein
VASALNTLTWQLGIARPNARPEARGPTKKRRRTREVQWATVPYDITIGNVCAWLELPSATKMARAIVSSKDKHAEVCLHVTVVFTTPVDFKAVASVEFGDMKFASKESQQLSHEIRFEFGSEFPCLWTVHEQEEEEEEEEE